MNANEPITLVDYMARAGVSRHQLAAATGRVWETVRNWERRLFAPDPRNLRVVRELCQMTEAELGRLVLWFAGDLPLIPRAATVCGAQVGSETCGKLLDHTGRHKGVEALATEARREAARAARELHQARLELAEVQADIDARDASSPKLLIDPNRIDVAPPPARTGAFGRRCSGDVAESYSLTSP